MNINNKIKETIPNLSYGISRLYSQFIPSLMERPNNEFLLLIQNDEDRTAAYEYFRYQDKLDLQKDIADFIIRQGLTEPRGKVTLATHNDYEEKNVTLQDTVAPVCELNEPLYKYIKGKLFMSRDAANDYMEVCELLHQILMIMSLDYSYEEFLK